MLADFREAGVRPISVLDPIPEGESQALFEHLKLHEARSYSVTLANHSGTGWMALLRKGFLTHSSKPPYGTDRLYQPVSGGEGHIIRNLSDGRQHRLHWKSKKVVWTFPAGCGNHYKKLKDEKVSFVLGDTSRVETVNRIFSMKFIQGFGLSRIARILNDEGVPAVHGGLWHTATLLHILENPVYLGRGMVNKMYCGEIAVRDYHSYKTKPAPIDAGDQRRKFGGGFRESSPKKVRPEGEWGWLEYATLENFLRLNQKMKERIALWQLNRYRIRGEGKTVDGKPVRHENTSYFLRDVLVVKGTKDRMKGHPTPPDRKTNRYYRVTAAYTNPKSTGEKRKLVPADITEEAAAQTLKTVLQNSDLISRRVKQYLSETQKERRSDSANYQKLSEERNRFRRMYKSAMTKASDDLLGQVGDIIEGWNAQASSLTRRLEAVQQLGVGTRPVAKDITARVLARCEEVVEILKRRNPVLLRRVVNLLLPMIEADFASDTLEYHCKLPTWMLTSRRSIEDVCLTAESDLCFDSQPHNLHFIPLSVHSYQKYRAKWRRPMLKLIGVRNAA